MLCYVIISYTFSLETTKLKLKLSKHAPSSFVSFAVNSFAIEFKSRASVLSLCTC